jgi:hypothetical protein
VIPISRTKRRAAAAATSTATVIALAGGCGFPMASGAKHRTAPTSPISASSMSFQYNRITGKNLIDQQLVITNHNSRPVAPTLRFTPLDGAGHPVAGVTVTTAFGSDRGQVVVGTSEIDILAFHGTDASAVRDVKVDVASLTAAQHAPVTRGLTDTFQDASGATVDRFSDFDKIILTNPNDADAALRIVYIVWDQPTDPNASQQAVSVTPIGGLVMVPHQGTTTVHVDDDAAAAAAVAKYGDGTNAVSVKVFASQ